MTGECWADPLNREERARLARQISRACKSFRAAGEAPGKGRRSFSMLAQASAEMSDLHLDVTERAAVAR